MLGNNSDSTWQPGNFYRDGASDNGLTLVQNYNMQQKFKLLRSSAENQILSDEFLAKHGLTGGKKFMFGSVSGKLINKHLPAAGDQIETYADLLEAASDSSNYNQYQYIEAVQDYEDQVSTGQIVSQDSVQNLSNTTTYTDIDFHLNNLSKPTAQAYDVMKAVSGRIGLGSNADARSLFFAVANPWTTGGMGAGIVSGSGNNDINNEGNIAIQAQAKMLYASMNMASINTGMQLMGDPRANSYLNDTLMDPTGLDSAARLLNMTEPSPTEVRPGVGAALLMMGNKSDIISSQSGQQAGKTRLYIDIFQMQNETALDYLMARTATDVNFSAHVTLATPSSGDATNVGILGKNLVTLGKLQGLNYMAMPRDSNLKSSYNRVNTKFANDRSHLKLMVDETFRKGSTDFKDEDLIGGVSILGSMNMTEPVGRDYNLSGSNFELISIARYHSQHEIDSASSNLKKEYNDTDPILPNLISTKRNSMEMQNILYRQRRKIVKDDAATSYLINNTDIRDSFNNPRTAAHMMIREGQETTDMRGTYEHLDLSLSYLSSHSFLNINNSANKNINKDVNNFVNNGLDTTVRFLDYLALDSNFNQDVSDIKSIIKEFKDKRNSNPLKDNDNNLNKIYELVDEIIKTTSNLAFKMQSSYSNDINKFSSIIEKFDEYLKDIYSLQGKAYEHKNKSARMIMLLDQTLLLQGTDLLRNRDKGAFNTEFGEYDREMKGYIEQGKLGERYQQLQRKTLNSVIEGRLTIGVDTRNFSEQILNPLIAKMNSVSDSVVNTKYNGNLLSYMRMIKMQYASQDTFAENILNSIMGGGAGDQGVQIYKDIFGQDSLNGVNNQTTHIRDTLRTLLAISSGNIQEASVPRQHAKVYSLFEHDNGGKVIPIAGTLGSSNFTPFSMQLLTEADFSNHETYMEYKKKLSLELNEVSLNPDYTNSFNASTAGYGVLSNREMGGEVASLHSQSMHNLISTGFSEALGWGQEQRNSFFQQDGSPRSFMGWTDQPQNVKGDVFRQIRNTESVKTAFNIIVDQLKRSSVTDVELFNRISQYLGPEASMESQLAEYEKAFHSVGEHGSEGYRPDINPYNMNISHDNMSYVFNNLGGVEVSLNTSIESGGIDSFNVKIGGKKFTYTVLDPSAQVRSTATENKDLVGTMVEIGRNVAYRSSEIISKDAGNFATPFGTAKPGMGNELYLNSAQTGVLAVLGNVLEYNYRKSIASPAEYINNVNNIHDPIEKGSFIRDLTVNFLSNLGMGSSNAILRGSIQNDLEAALGYHKNLIGADGTPIKGETLDRGLAGVYGKPVEITNHLSYLFEDAGTDYNSSGGDSAVNRFVEYLQDPRFSKVISNVRKLDENTKGDVYSKIDVIYDYQGKTYGVQVKSSKTGSKIHLIKNREEIVDTNIDSRNPGVFWVHKNFKDDAAALDMVADFIDPTKKAQDAVVIKETKVREFLIQARDTLILLTEHGGKITEALHNSYLPSDVNVAEYAEEWHKRGYYKTRDAARDAVISVRTRLAASRNPHMTDLYDVVKNTVELTRGLNANYGNTRREALDKIIYLFNTTIDQFSSSKVVGGSISLDTFSETLGNILGFNSGEERAKGHALSDVFALMAHGLSDSVNVNEMAEQHYSTMIPTAILGQATNSQFDYTRARFEYTDNQVAFLERSMNSPNVGIANLYNVSAYQNPMIFDPTKYGGTGFYALASAISTTSMQYYSTATGARMQELSVLNDWEALEAIGLGYIIDGDQDGNDISKFTESKYYRDIATVANLGNEFLESQKIQAIAGYNAVVASNQAAFVNKDRLLITRTGKKEKLFQFAQRIRNAMGTKSKVALSAEYTHYINLLNSFDASDRSKADDYIKTIRNNFRIELFGNDGRTSEREATAALLFGGYFPHMMTMGYQFDSDIRPLMAPSQLKIYENMKAKLNGDEYNNLFDDKQKKHLLRAWAITRDQLSGTSMTGAPIIADRDGYRWEDQPIMLLRLGGYLHDATYYANAGFGREININGNKEVVPTRYGNINVQNRKVKSYGLMNDFSMSNLNIGIGDIVSIDPHTGEAYLVRKGSNIVHTLNSQQTSQVVNNAANAVAAATNLEDTEIGSEKLITLLRGIKDKSTSGSGGVVEAALGARVSISYHNDSIEIKTGLGTAVDAAGSATIVRNVAIRSSMLVSGDRQEANFGLFKSVVQMFNKEGFEYRAEKYSESQENGFAILGGKLKGHQIHGIANISSFKAYMPGHGAQLLRHQEGVNELTEGINKLNAERVAAAMLLTFGVEAFTSYDSSGKVTRESAEEYAKKISKQLHMYGKEADAPEVLKNISIVSPQDSDSFLRGGINKLNKLDIVNNRLFEFFNSARGGVDLAEVLKGDTAAKAKFIGILNKIINSSAKIGENYTALSTGSMQDMYAESFVAGLHVGMQLISSQQQYDNMPANYENYAFEIAAVSAGYTSQEIYEIMNAEDKTRKNKLASMFYGLDMSMRTVGLFLGHSPSASKVAVGSRGSGEIEFQLQQKALIGAADLVKSAHERKKYARKFFAALKSSFSGRGQVFEENIGTLFDVIGLVDDKTVGNEVTGIETYIDNNSDTLIGSYYLHALNAAEYELEDQWKAAGSKPNNRPTIKQQQERADQIYEEARKGMKLLGRARAYFDMENSEASVGDRARDMFADSKFNSLYQELLSPANSRFLDISLKAGKLRKTSNGNQVIGSDNKNVRNDITLREFLDLINPTNLTNNDTFGYSGKDIYNLLKAFHKTAMRSMFRDVDMRGLKSGLYIVDYAEKFVEHGLKDSGNSRDILLELPAILESSGGTGGIGYLAVDLNQKVRGIVLGSNTLISLGMHKLGDNTADVVANQLELHTMMAPDSDVMSFYRMLAKEKKEGRTGAIVLEQLDKRMVEKIQRFQDLLTGSINSLQEQGQIAASNRITVSIERQTRVVTSNPWLAEGIAVTGQGFMEIKKRRELANAEGRSTKLAQYDNTRDVLLEGIKAYIGSFTEILEDTSGASSNNMMDGNSGNGPRNDLRKIINELKTLKKDIDSTSKAFMSLSGQSLASKMNMASGDDPKKLAEWQVRLGNLENRARANSLSSLIYRPQPLGGLNISYLHHQIVDVQTYNEAVLTLATNRTNDSDIKNQFMQLNEARSKSLLMVSTVGRMVQNLGDYDGDMVIMIESNIVDLQTRLSQTEVAISTLENSNVTTHNGKSVDEIIKTLNNERIKLTSQITNLQQQYSTNYHLKKTRQFIADLVGLDYDSIGSGYDSYHYQKLRNQYKKGNKNIGDQFKFGGYAYTGDNSINGFAPDNTFTTYMEEVNRRVENELIGINGLSEKNLDTFKKIISEKIERELIQEGLNNGQMDKRFVGFSLASMLSMHDKGYTLSESRNAWAKFNVEESYNSIYDILYAQMSNSKKEEKFRNLIHLKGSANVAQELSHMKLLAERFYNQLEPQVGDDEAKRRAAGLVLSEFYQHIVNPKYKGEVLEGIQKIFSSLNIGAATTTNILEGSLQIQAELASNILGKAVNFFSLTLYGNMSTGIISEAVHNNYDNLVEIKKAQLMAKNQSMNEKKARALAIIELNRLKNSIDRENRRFERIQGIHQTIGQSLRDFIKPAGDIDKISKELSRIQTLKNYTKRRESIVKLASEIGPSDAQSNFMVLSQFSTIVQIIHGGIDMPVLSNTGGLSEDFKLFLSSPYEEGGLGVSGDKIQELIKETENSGTEALNTVIHKMLAQEARDRLLSLIVNTRAATHLKDRDNSQLGVLEATARTDLIYKHRKKFTEKRGEFSKYLKQHWLGKDEDAVKKRKDHVKTLIMKQSEFDKHIDSLDKVEDAEHIEYLKREREHLAVLTEIYVKSEQDINAFAGNEGERLLSASPLTSAIFGTNDLSDPAYAHVAPFLGAWIAKAAHGKEGIGTREIHRSLSMSLFNMIKDVQWLKTVDGSPNKELVTGHVTEESSEEDIREYSKTVKKQMLRQYLYTMSDSMVDDGSKKNFRKTIDLITSAAEDITSEQAEGHIKALEAGLDSTAFGNIIKHINNVFDVYIDSIKRRKSRDTNRDVKVNATVGGSDPLGDRDMSLDEIEHLYNNYFARKEYNIRRVRDLSDQKRFNGEIMTYHEASMHIESTGQIYDSLIYPLLVGLGGALANSNQNSNNGINEAAGAFFSNMVFQLESHRAAQLIELGKTRTTLKTLGSMSTAILGGSMISIRNEIYHHPDESYGQAFMQAYQDRFRMTMWSAVVSATMQGHMGMSEDLSRLTTRLNRRLGEGNVLSRATRSASEFLEEGLSGVLMNRLNIGPEIDMPGYVKARSLFSVITSIAVGMALQVSGAQKAVYALAGITEDAQLNNYVVTQAYRDAAEIKAAAQQSALQAADVNIELIRSEASDIAVGILSGPTGNGEFNSMYSDQQMENLNITIYNENNNADGPQGLIAPDTGLQYST